MRTVQCLTRRRTIMAAVAMGFAGRAANAQAPAEADPWPSLAEQIFGKQAIADGSSCAGDRCALSRRRCRRGPGERAQHSPAWAITAAFKASPW